MVSDNSYWNRVSPDNPCPVCGRPDWCSVSNDGQYVICPRTSQGSVKHIGDAGWLHKLAKDDSGKRRLREFRVDCTPAKDFSGKAAEYMAKLGQNELAQLSAQLGVTVESLVRLGVGWNGRCYTFPMSDEKGRIIGIRTRFPSGDKAAEKESRQGLFVPSELSGQGPLLICEGPTDTAAALDLGFDAVGRPSCLGGGNMLKNFVVGRDVAIIADNDPPGVFGANILGAELPPFARSVKVLFPPVSKDLREWVRTSPKAAAHDALAALIAAVFPEELTIRVGNWPVSKRGR
jgi:hypothetical protein